MFSAMSNEKKYNLTNLKNMIGDDPQAIKNFTSIYLTTSRQVMDDLLTAFDASDYPKIGALAHKLKSSIDLMGITDLKEDIRTIEANAKEAINLNELPALIAKLKRTIRIASSQLEEDIL